jgi:hypothetical protein
VITAAGPVTFCAGVDLAKVKAAIAKSRAPAKGELPEGVAAATAGDFYDDLTSLTNKVAKGAAMQKVMAQVNEVQKSPAVARAVGLSTVVVPGSAGAMMAYEAADATIKKLGAGDQATIDKVGQVTKMAQAGHPKAMTALRVLQVVRQHQLGAQAVLNPAHRQGLVVAYSRELRATLPPNLLKLLGPSLDQALKASQPGPRTAVAGWAESGGGVQALAV